MNVLKKCCFRSMKENRKRTLVTIIGVVLATALITGVACLTVSFRVSLIAYDTEKNGNFHYCFYGVSPENIKIFKNNRNLKSIGLMDEVGYAKLEGSQNPDKPYLYISAADAQGMESMALHLTEGRLPENASELVIGRHIRSNGLVDLKVGDVLTLEVGSRMSDGYKLNQSVSYTYENETLKTVTEKTYTIVGIVERPGYMVEERMAPGYSAFTMLDGEAVGESVNVYAVYTDWGLRHAPQVNAGILNVSEDLYRRYYVDCGRVTKEEEEQITRVASRVSENYWLLKWILLSFSNHTIRMLYAMAGLAVLIIVVTSVFCIRNGFEISLTEKMKLYGRLSSVGTTSAQQKKMVYYEAFFLGMTGIPLGILSGVLASVILVKVVSGMVETAMDVPLIFGVSLPAIAVAAVLSAVTIILSARKSARKAAKLSPIGAIRGNDSIRIRRRELNCPQIIDKLFGVGGRIAYKNLKRARVKYRTTVVSIVVSVAVFIGLSTFTQLLAFASGFYYDNRQYQIQVTLRGENAYERANFLAALDGVKAVDIRQAFSIRAVGKEIPFTEDYKAKFEVDEEEPIGFVTLGASGYADYCRLIGVSVEKAKDKAIVLAEYENNVFGEDNKLHTTSGRIADYRAGNVIEGNDGENKISVEVLLQTDKKPMSMDHEVHNYVVLIVSDEWAAEHLTLKEDRWVNVYFRCEDAGALEEAIRMHLLGSYTLSNYDASYKSEKATSTVLFIFLYGFITVVALIGITNIFNTITTNMELRAPDFAMLRSVGMTGREFRRMIWLEGFFYGGKALLIGIPLGILLSFGFHRALAEGIVTDFQMPWMGIGVSVFAVIVLLFGIMHYSMGRIKRKNIIETIQNENI